MDHLNLWCSCLILGSVFSISGIALFCLDKRHKEIAYAKMSLLEIIAAWIMIFPDVYLSESAGSALHIIKSVLLSLLSVLQIFAGNAYARITIDGNEFLTDIYVVALTIVNILILISLIGFVFQLLSVFFERTLFDIKKVSKVYLFSDLNEKTLSIAGSVFRKEQNNSYKIIFIDNDTEGASRFFRAKAKEINAFCSNNSFEDELRKLLNKTGNIDVFLFGRSEEDNLAGLNGFTKMDLDGKCAFTRVYVELTDSPWDIYGNFVNDNGLPEDKVVINLINSNEIFVLNDLFDHSVFEKTYREDNNSDQIIDVLIAGYSGKSIEMIKSLLMLCQMPGYELRLTLLDDGLRTAGIRRIIPELKDRSDVVGDSIYTCNLIDNVRFDTDELEKTVLKICPKFTFAFISAGDQRLNVDLGLRLNTMRYRLNNGVDYSIQVCADTQDLTKNWVPELKKNIMTVGGTDSIYDIDFITMSKIERASRAIHDIRQRDKKEKADRENKEFKTVSWNEYSGNEFNRHSVFARTLSLKYKLKVITDRGLGIDVIKTDSTWETYEHMRWNMYTRTLGYVWSGNTGIKTEALSRNEKRIAKIHDCLVPFEELDEEERSKDSINLTDAVAAVFKEIN